MNIRAKFGFKKNTLLQNKKLSKTAATTLTTLTIFSVIHH